MIRYQHQGCISDKGHHTTQQVPLLSLIILSNYAARTDILYFKLRRQSERPAEQATAFQVSGHFSCCVPLVSPKTSHGGLKHPARSGETEARQGQVISPEVTLQQQWSSGHSKPLSYPRVSTCFSSLASSVSSLKAQK